MKVSFICTIFNEEQNIVEFLNSIVRQSENPDEIIIVDGGSTDNTLSLIYDFKSSHLTNSAQVISNKKIKIQVVTKKGNRSVGRNEAIRLATGEIIACSDSGCILDKDWLRNITKPFHNKKVEVVAGYYKGKSKNIFQKSLVSYVLVMPDKVDSENFLPASRSMAFRKSIWEKSGGFDESLSHNEDYAFAIKLKELNIKMVFRNDAIVSWIPRTNLKKTFVMFFRFALGDAESKIFREKVVYLFLRYLLAIYLILLGFIMKTNLAYLLILTSFTGYIIWSIKKNYKYVNDPKAIIYLPILQFCSDFAVLSGTIFGFLKTLKLKKDYYLLFIILFYIFVELLVLRWGAPNKNHPFPYHMDEWHQIHAVATTFRNGTPNIAGSANGTMLHFVLSGIYLIPFAVFKIIDITGLRLDDYFLRERLFVILRISTIIWGVLSILVLNKITKLITKKNGRRITLFLFVFTPIWLMLSGYFKYDIALIFWILLSIYFLLRFAKTPTRLMYILAGISCALAISVKVSAIPLVIMYVLSYFWFNLGWKKDFKYLISGSGILVLYVLVFGMSDAVLGKGNIVKYLIENVIDSSSHSLNINIEIPQSLYLFFHQYPIIFGRGFIFLLVISLLFSIIFLLKINFRKISQEEKIISFIFICLLLFVISILPLKIYGGGNRSLVLLPFFVLLIGLVMEKLLNSKKLKKIIIIIIIISFTLQIYECSLWIYSKVVKSPQENASAWMISNIPKGTIIGIENVPIYQAIPDIVQKEFYFSQYLISNKNNYRYEIVDSKTKKLPSVIIIANGEIEKILYKKTVKKDLMQRIEKDRYKRVAVFQPSLKLLRLSDNDFYFSWLLAAPLTISIYKK